jgi:hypothetical protein
VSFVTSSEKLIDTVNQQRLIFYSTVETLDCHNNSRQLFIEAEKPLKASFLIKIVWAMLRN